MSNIRKNGVSWDMLQENNKRVEKEVENHINENLQTKETKLNPWSGEPSEIVKDINKHFVGGIRLRLAEFDELKE